MLQHSPRKDAKYPPAVEPFVGLRFGLHWGCLDALQMDPESPVGTKVDAKARRVQLVIFLVTAILIVAPILAYLKFGTGGAPRP